MMNDVEDLLNINDRIQQVRSDRDQLASKLQNLRQSMASNDTEVARSELIAQEIIDTGSDARGIERLRAKYGNLQVLDKLEKVVVQRTQLQASIDQLNGLDHRLDELTQQPLAQFCLDDIEILNAKLRDAFATVPQRACTDSQRAAYGNLESNVIAKYNKLLQKLAINWSDSFDQELLEAQWDTSKFVSPSVNLVEHLRETSAKLYRLSQLYLPLEQGTQSNANVNHRSCSTNGQGHILWNFKSMANNFNVRFTYHFHATSSKIETYFQFLNDYLTENLYKCINIFHCDSRGLTKQIIHEQFINYVLQPIRDKVKSTLFQNDLKTLIVLISQILATDKNLLTSFHYHGLGLVSLISDEIWEKWINYEVETANRQFINITKNPEDFPKSSLNFVKLINKIYDYLEPFYNLDFDLLIRYKLMTCSLIFMNLTSSYLDYILTVDSLNQTRTKEQELYQTMAKLQHVNLVYKKIRFLSSNFIFIQLTDVVNNTESKKYNSLFQNVENDYEKAMNADMQNSIVHRIQKLLKETLRNYFKISTWSTLETPIDENDGAATVLSAELVNSMNVLTRLINKLDSLDIPLAISLKVKNELLNIIVNYFTESILKLNKFNRDGLNQFLHDFESLRSILSLPSHATNYKCMSLHELINILKLKYDPNNQQFLDPEYIKTGDFTFLKEIYSIKYLKDTKIQDALYRIIYGNIV
ncbi:TIP20-like protein [Saccharomyces kudriavzevii IFO 1802]|uniref:TIP20-like protein n=2 Tax=Saccharomyces kudriavzevii (strain ATCC MYA-4449 / AS 2.2408 / CBS 8840 / NBRC 1802 / NCYC 2889) TaxID=226230 RepID=J5RHX2_SACK1|nr:TIP20-like protein [Saccharomyces kudriavzevii IFO 1802]